MESTACGAAPWHGCAWCQKKEKCAHLATCVQTLHAGLAQQARHDAAAGVVLGWGDGDGVTRDVNAKLRALRGDEECRLFMHV